MDLDALYAAAISGDTDAIAKLEIEASKLHKYNRTILHIESMYGNTENVRFIVREFANKKLLLVVDRSGGTALHLAAEKGYTQVVELLLDAARCLPSSTSRNPVTPFQAFVRRYNNNRSTALHIAASNGKVDIAKLLVEADPDDTHIQNSYNESPVYIAADLGYNNIVKIICTTCTAPSLDGPGGQTAFHAAIRNLHKAKREDRDVFRVLIDAAKRSPCSQDGINTSVISLFVQPSTITRVTVLQQAVQGNHLDEVKMILAEKSAFKRQIENSDCDFKTLINTATERGYKDMVKFLCKTYEAENTLGQKGLTALLGAIRVRDKESVLHLLGDDKRLVTYEDDVGWTPLHYAADCEFDTILNDIVQAQVYVGYQYVSGDNMVPTPLIIAAKKGYTSTVIQLMKLLPASSCVDVNDDGQNILHLAAVQRNIEMIRCILKHCPEEYSDKILNNKDDNGDTPLHLLIREGCFVPELIAHKGVDTMAVNNSNFTPFDMLYFNDEIISEQVQIKEALDTKANHNWKFWRRSVKGKSNMQESLVPPSKRSKKDAEFKKAREFLMSEKQKRMKADLERYKKRTNTQIIVTALITTVTFTVGFTMPGGYHQSGEPDQGLVLLSRKSAFVTFMVADALALLLSTSSLFLYFIESMYEDPQQVAKINAASTGLNIVSVIAMMLTFITGTYVVLSHSPVLAVTVCVIGSFFFLFVTILLIKMIWDRKLDRHQV